MGQRILHILWLVAHFPGEVVKIVSAGRTRMGMELRTAGVDFDRMHVADVDASVTVVPNETLDNIVADFAKKG